MGGWQEYVQLDQAYAPVVLVVDSARLLFADIAYCEVELASEFLLVAARQRGFGAPRRWERGEWDESVPPVYFSFFSETEVVLKGTPHGTPGSGGSPVSIFDGLPPFYNSLARSVPFPISRNRMVMIQILSNF